MKEGICSISLTLLQRRYEMNKPEPTILEPDEVAVVYSKDEGYKFLIPDTLDDEEVPDEAAVLVAMAMRLSNDEEFYQEMLGWLRKDIETSEQA